MHITSLPSPFGAGDIGPLAHAFADWLSAAGFSVWQMLPVGPVGFAESPYSSPSSFAIEPTFLALEPLVLQGLLSKADLKPSVAASRRKSINCDFKANRAFRMSRAAKAAIAFHAARLDRSSEYRAFVRKSSWLSGWLDFVAGEGIAQRRLHAFIQFELARQWKALRSHCAAVGVRLVGDVPIFVTAESADVRANRHLFRLRQDGSPAVLTGVPPDDFSADGQLWGHPHYAWPEHRKEKFAWWISRIACAIERFDLVRIDHFIGLHNAYEVPFGARTARNGVWRKAPGRELLAAMAKVFGPLPLIAEDLGALTPAVEALRDDFGLAGMRIVQNAFWSGRAGDMPHNHPRRSVAYSCTHDNETTMQWWKSRNAMQRARFISYSGAADTTVHEAMARIVMASPAALAVLPMQDLLGLGKSARLNLPGTATGNWKWCMERGAASKALAQTMRSLIEATGRL